MDPALKELCQSNCQETNQKYFCQMRLLNFTKREALHFLQDLFKVSKRHLLLLKPWYITFSNIGWANQCVCMKHTNLMETIIVLNSLGKKFNSAVLGELNYEKIIDSIICPDSIGNEYKTLICLSSKIRKSCIQHETRNTDCNECSHSCSNQIFEATARIYNNFSNETIRYPRFISIDNKMTYVSGWVFISYLLIAYINLTFSVPLIFR